MLKFNNSVVNTINNLLFVNIYLINNKVKIIMKNLQNLDNFQNLNNYSHNKFYILLHIMIIFTLLYIIYNSVNIDICLYYLTIMIHIMVIKTLLFLTYVAILIISNNICGYDI